MMTLVVFAVAWGLVTGWDAASWIVGAPAVIVAAWLGRVLRPEPDVRVAPMGLLRLFPFFIWQSMRAGVDVAIRAVRGVRAIDPAVIRVPARLSSVPARGLVVTISTLLPGSLALDVDENDYVIHALVGLEDAVVRDLRQVERHVAPVFGLRPPEEDEAG